MQIRIRSLAIYATVALGHRPDRAEDTLVEWAKTDQHLADLLVRWGAVNLISIMEERQKPRAVVDHHEHLARYWNVPIGDVARTLAGFEKTIASALSNFPNGTKLSDIYTEDQLQELFKQETGFFYPNLLLGTGYLPD